MLLDKRPPTAVVRRGRAQARKVTRARILLHASRGVADSEIVLATVERTRRRFVEAGLEALNECPRPGARRRLSAKAEARLVAEACSAHKGRRRHGRRRRRRWLRELTACERKD